MSSMRGSLCLLTKEGLIKFADAPESIRALGFSMIPNISICGVIREFELLDEHTRILRDIGTLGVEAHMGVPDPSLFPTPS